VEENEWHCFFGCNTAADVWKETNERQIISNYTENAMGFVEMMFRLINEVEPTKVARIVMTMWALWWRRNQRCWNDKIPTIFDVIQRAINTRHEWLRAQRQSYPSSTFSACNQWRKPPTGTIKCNVDTACYMEDNIYCVGMCMRDEHGRFLQAYTTKKHGTPAIAEAEALGIWEALTWV
jgi:hypothetical protein